MTFSRRLGKNLHLEIWKTGLGAKTTFLKGADLGLYFNNAFMP